MPTCPWMGDNMTMQNWNNRRSWNATWPGIGANHPLHQFHGPPPNMQPTPPAGMLTHPWNVMPGYWPTSNSFQYRPSTRFSAQHLRTRHSSRLSRTYHHGGIHYHYPESDESDENDNERLNNARPGSRNSRRNNSQNDNNNNQDNAPSEEVCFICGEPLHNCDEQQVHMCHGNLSDNEDILSEPDFDECQPMDVHGVSDEKTKRNLDVPSPSTSENAAERDVIEAMRSCLKQEKEQVTLLRKDANDILIKLKSREEIVTKREKDVEEREKKTTKTHDLNKAEIKRQEQQLRDECKRMEELHDVQKGQVKLDIGGHHFSTSTSTLTVDPNSMLAAMFSGRHSVIKQEDGTVFIDRDGTNFRYILNYLRDGPAFLDTLPRTRQTLRELRNEAAFYQLPGLVQQIESLLN